MRSVRAIAFVLMSILEVGCASSGFTRSEVRSCVDQIFDDPDAYDPAAHFEIAGDMAPPFPEAAAWVNDALGDCLDNVPKQK